MASATLTPRDGASRPMVSGPFRYANAQDLPSYPSPGLKEGGAAASAAATLGWANSTVSPASPASTAVGFGPSRESQAGAIDALRAAGWAQRHQKQPSSPPSAWVSTAANLAFRTSNTPPPTTEHNRLARQNSMHAARGAMAGSRPRAISSPQPARKSETDQENAVANVASAGTITHRPSVQASTISAGEAGAVPYTTMDRQMFTSNPPVKPEVDEQKRADVLHASALAMAKKMYEQQQKRADNSTRAHTRSSTFPGSGTDSAANSGGERQTPVVFNNLQEAAYRLAQERLAKLQEEHEKQRGLQEYYGSPGGPQRTKLGTIKGKLTRKRSSSDGDLLDDRQRSEHIRKQMSLLNNKLTEVDEEKRARDREALLAAAQRNVKAQLQEMDEKMQSETGRLPQTTMDDWGRKARVAAQARFDATNLENAGKVDIGGGKFMDRSEVDKIAAKKVQPLLDEINERAEKEKERIEQEEREAEWKREEAEAEKMREKEIQDNYRKLKEQQKDDERARKAEIKQEEKVRKDEAKAIKTEQKLAAGKDGKQKEPDALLPPPTIIEKTEPQNPPIQPSPDTGTSPIRALSVSFPKRQRQRKGNDTTTTEKPEADPSTTTTSPTQKVRTWLRSRLSRPRAATAPSSAPVVEQQQQDFAGGGTTIKKSFIGGVALARMEGRNVSSSSVTGRLDKGKGREESISGGGGDGVGGDNVGGLVRPDESLREVALAGLSPPPLRYGGGAEVGESSATAAGGLGVPPSPSTPPPPASQVSVPVSVSPVSSLGSSSGSGDEVFVEARSEVGSPSPPVNTLMPPRVARPVGGRVSPFRESRFSEILE